MSDYQLLLDRVRLLYEKHEAGRRKPFNVFSVLRSPSDEVDLHSRFLHALLDYRESPKAERENLKDFLQHVVEKQFEENGAKVERERNYIDILITNDAQQAVVIENKIGSGYRDEQLQRYYNKLQEMGYRDIHLLYLTPHGDELSEDSVGDLDYETLSYKGDLLPWLERCQQRAYDEPALRESVAQYRQLVRKLTVTDLTGAYMNELKKLLLQDNNLVLAHTLREATTEVHIELLQKLWREIDDALTKEISDLPTRNEKLSDISDNRIRKFVTAQKNYKYHGLFYSFGNRGGASLGVEVDQEIRFGVYCDKSDKKYQNERVELEKALSKNVGNGIWSDNWWPWVKSANGNLNLKYPTRENIELLSNDDSRNNYVQGITQGLKEVWNTVKAAGLA